MGCLRREGRAELRLLTRIVPIAIGVIVGPCRGLCATLPIFLCQEPVGCGGDLEICLLLPGDGEGGVDRGIRAERSFLRTPGVKTSSPKDYEGNWAWSFSRKKSKGSSCTEKQQPSQTLNQEGCPEKGLGRKKL